MNDRYINRELSWLEFNQRVLNEAHDEQNPLLERLKFLAITSSNLDEFFRVRFGGLQILAQHGSTRRDPSGMTPEQQVHAISQRARQMVNDQYSCFLGSVKPALSTAGIQRLTKDNLEQSQYDYLNESFLDEAVSVLTPIAVGEGHSWPHLENFAINLCVRIAVDEQQPRTLPMEQEEEEGQRTERFVIIPIGEALPRLLRLPAEGLYRYILVEDAISMFAERFFPSQDVLECVPFRVTRNADMSVSEDGAADLLEGMRKVLDAREASPCIRLEISASTEDVTRDFLMTQLKIGTHQVFDCDGPLELSAYFRLAEISGFEHLQYEPWPPQASPEIDPSESMFDTLMRRDVMLSHPYESFDPVVRLLEEASDDPDVLSIKQTLYRTSRKSPIVAALARAAGNGKNVTALVELKARFDEARNIGWARQLERAGVHVIYGVKGLKTHAKLCVIVRREPQGIQRYLHFGTGNYNESTARLYSDISLMTTDEDLGRDAISFFNAVCGYSQPQAMRKLEAAPIGLRERLLELIEIEKQQVQNGQKGLIQAKVNSLVDPTLIDALYDASQAGVRVELNVRGICCLRPGIKGLSENIRVISIVDRFLEHARICYFYHGGDPRLFISSADWMPRNLDKRLELLVPVEDPQHQQSLIANLATYFSDNVKARVLQSDGSYEKIVADRGKRAHRSQADLYQAACEAMLRAKRTQLTAFEPHRGHGVDE